MNDDAKTPDTDQTAAAEAQPTPSASTQDDWRAGGPAPQDEAQQPTFERSAVVRFAVTYVLAWVLVLLGVAVAEVILDPELDSVVGETLDAASAFIFAVGWLAVPFGTGAYARGNHAGWGATFGFAFGALGAFLVGAAADLAIYHLLVGD